MKTGLWFLRRFPATLSLVALVLLAFAIQSAMGGTTDLAVAMRLGALRADRVAEHGEYFRLMLAPWLHHGLVHLLLDVAALLQLASLVEYVWGGLRTVVFFLFTGVVATLVAAVFGPAGIPVYGASGGVLGLAGLLLGARYIGDPTLRLFLHEVLGRRLSWGVLATLGVGFVLELAYPMVSSWGHIGGFLAGIGLAFAVPEAHSGRGLVQGLAAALAAGLLGSVGWATVAGGDALPTLDADMADVLRHRVSEAPGGLVAVRDLPVMLDHYEAAGQVDVGLDVYGEQVAAFDDSTALQLLLSRTFEAPDRTAATQLALERWLELEPHHPSALNAMAWHLLTRPDEAQRDPRRAVELSRKSLRRIPDPTSVAGRGHEAACLDTLGEGLLQLGELDEALVVQRQSLAIAEELELADREAIAARMGRIEAAIAARPDPP